MQSETLLYGTSGEVTIPCPSYLIEHQRGLVLFDTGLHPDAITDPERIYGADLVPLLGIGGSEDQRLDNQITALGYKLSDVTHVISSHGHFDHTGGLFLFPEAKHFFGEGELRYANWPDPIQSFVYRQEVLDVIRRLDTREVVGDLDLFGDGAITILATPGHSPGEVSLAVRLPSRTFLLTGDAIHLRAQMEQEYHFPIDADTKTALRSLRRLKNLRESMGATVWISHDPEDWAEFVHAPGFYE
ncbi:N-acyl homoserine lactonase family protein [Cnuibacter physcomitrellae]|uniref:N-acyl homoserine lactonase family protein n=1 Tax=Cnuibacter physcomitrellae TaxID=1619308 RepID=UPI001E48E3AB|nr:N-acyl homoserine lactonase family protein [Cnuibacter physcomitrellae]